MASYNKFYQTMICGFLGFLAGCGNSHIPQNERPQTNQPQNDMTNLLHSRECLAEAVKMPASSAIINGKPDSSITISEGQKKAIVSVILQDGGFWDVGCTATVVAPKVLITAAHCVVDDNLRQFKMNKIKIAVGEDVEFAVGEYNMISEYFGSEIFTPKEILWNQLYDGEDSSYDHALFIMEEDMTQAVPGLQPIKLNTSRLNTRFVGTVMQNVGYGATSVDEDDDGYYNTKKWWTTEAVTGLTDGYYTVNGLGVSSVCFGDSGGPGLLIDRTGVLKVYGTVSGGDESCVDEDEYTRIDSDLSWICSASGDLLEVCRETPGDADSDDSETDNECSALGWHGQCRDGVALWCHNGQLQTRNCAKCGQICEETATMGAYCTNAE